MRSFIGCRVQFFLQKPLGLRETFVTKALCLGTTCSSSDLSEESPPKKTMADGCLCDGSSDILGVRRSGDRFGVASTSTRYGDFDRQHTDHWPSVCSAWRDQIAT